MFTRVTSRKLGKKCVWLTCLNTFPLRGREVRKGDLIIGGCPELVF